MENTVNINKNKENTLEFTLTVEGLSSAEGMDVRLCIETERCNYVFKAVKDIQDKYKVIVPPMPELEKTMFPCKLEVITHDGYYFNAMSGNINVVTDANISGQPVNQTTSTQPAPISKPAVEEPQEEVVKKEDEELTIDFKVPTTEKEIKDTPSIAELTKAIIDKNKKKDDDIVKEAFNAVNKKKAPIKKKEVKPKAIINETANKNDAKIKAILGEAGHKSEPKAKSPLIKKKSRTRV